MKLFNASILALLLVSGQAADIFTQFYVDRGAGAVTRSAMSGNLGGSCYEYADILNPLYTEAIDMAQVALDSLGDYATSPTVRATVETFFGIKPDGTSVSVAHSNTFNLVKDYFQQVVNFATTTYNPESLEPAFFCDDGWRWKTTQEYVNQVPTGRSIFEATGGTYTWMYWSPRIKKWAGPAKEGCTDQILGFTLNTVKSITMCPFAWSYSRRKDSLKEYRDGTTAIPDGRALSQYYSLPGTFLHELMHYVSNLKITDQPVTVNGVAGLAYYPTRVAALASMDSGVDLAYLNADTYAWFATAMYLASKDWSRLVNGVPRSTTISSRSDRNSSSYQEMGNGLKHRTYFTNPKLAAPEDSGAFNEVL